MDMEELCRQMKECHACKLRAGCTQVVCPIGNLMDPKLLIIGEGPGQSEDEEGEPFCGTAGRVLRDVLRRTKILNRTNTAISNVIHCRPPKNKFPTDEIPSICIAQWLSREIEILKPERMLLLGGQALKHVAGMDKITSCRGGWYQVRGIRTMATYHPSYVMRCDNEGDMMVRSMFERDIAEVAEEVRQLLEQTQTSEVQ